MSSLTAEPRSRRYSLTFRPWVRPSWNDYCDVVLGYSEQELVLLFCAATKVSAASATKSLQRHIKLLVRAGAMGTAPGYRKALAPLFRQADHALLHKLMAKLTIAYLVPPANLPERLRPILKRAITTTALINKSDKVIMGFVAQIEEREASEHLQ